MSLRSLSCCPLKVGQVFARIILTESNLLDVFSISGRGTVVTGRVERGTALKGTEVEIIGFGQSIKTTLTGVGKLTALLQLARELTRTHIRDVPQRAGPGRSWR